MHERASPSAVEHVRRITDREVRICLWVLSEGNKNSGEFEKGASIWQAGMDSADKVQHVAIHVKNEGLNLTIAEGSSGRGRL